MAIPIDVVLKCRKIWPTENNKISAPNVTDRQQTDRQQTTDNRRTADSI